MRNIKIPKQCRVPTTDDPPCTTSGTRTTDWKAL